MTTPCSLDKPRLATSKVTFDARDDCIRVQPAAVTPELTLT